MGEVETRRVEVRRSESDKESMLWLEVLGWSRESEGKVGNANRALRQDRTKRVVREAGCS